MNKATDWINKELTKSLMNYEATDNAPVTAQDFEKAICENNRKKTLYNFDFLLFVAREQAFSEGRKQGLKEMDEAYGTTLANKSDAQKLLKLRQEYSAK